MKVQGIIKLVNETATLPSGFRKREVVLTTKEQYPQDLSIEFLQDKVDLLNSYSKGDEVEISINLRGREWINPEGVAKYFNSIVGWRIEKQSEVINDVPVVDQPKSEEDNDLPF